MGSKKSEDDSIAIIAALLRDVQNVHGSVFNTRTLRLTTEKVKSRVSAEGMSFLTKTLPRLGKAFDKAISGNTPLNSTELRFDPLPGTQLPRFLGELFSKVLRPDGALLEQPCAQCVRTIRQVLYLFYKYELPYTDEQEQQVINAFKQAEHDLSALHPVFQTLEQDVVNSYSSRRGAHKNAPSTAVVAREAKCILSDVFAYFDPMNIHPRHGPGAVATKQRLWDKYLWKNVSANITKTYPLDAYFYASMGHVCDSLESIKTMSEEDLPARVCLVPKDSRGPRLISCEPVDYQWIQQGLGRALVDWVEHCELTSPYIHFTDQGYNRVAALHGSKCGRYSTLDLKEASDRVSLDLVRLLWPEHLYNALCSCRSSSTVLPNGEVIKLNKFAPMGSSLCFPVLAITIWALIYAAMPNAECRDCILVYGDDVIIPTTEVANVIDVLESFGLKINQDKSCTNGLFRESCGMDAFNGEDVTPVRLRTVWTDSPNPDPYLSWIAYANSFYDKGYYLVYEQIVQWLHRSYGAIPGDEQQLKGCPSLRSVPESELPRRRRWNKALQKVEFCVRCAEAPQIRHSIDGWSMLLRFFSEASKDCPSYEPEKKPELDSWNVYTLHEPFSVRRYTDRSSNRLLHKWLSV